MAMGPFSTKNAKIANKTPVFATSGRDTSTMITDRRIFTTELTLYGSVGMSSFHFFYR